MTEEYPLLLVFRAIHTIEKAYEMIPSHDDSPECEALIKAHDELCETWKLLSEQETIEHELHYAQ